MSYSEAIAQGGALGGAAMGGGRREAAGEARGLLLPVLDARDGALGPQALVEPGCQTARCHGGDGEMGGFCLSLNVWAAVQKCKQCP